MTDFLKPDAVTDDVVVSLEYTLTVNNEIIDASEENEPLEYLQGHQNIIPGLERALYGMKIGDSKEVNISSTDGYGDVDPDAIIDIPRQEFPQDLELKPGTELQLQNQQGELLNAVVTSVTNEAIRLDFNHPLAGKDLFFRVTVVGLRTATEEELAHGHVHAGGILDEEIEYEFEEDDDDGDHHHE